MIDYVILAIWTVWCMLCSFTYVRNEHLKREIRRADIYVGLQREKHNEKIESFFAPSAVESPEDEARLDEILTQNDTLNDELDTLRLRAKDMIR